MALATLTICATLLLYVSFPSKTEMLLIHKSYPRRLCFANVTNGQILKIVLFCVPLVRKIILAWLPTSMSIGLVMLWTLSPRKRKR